MQPCDEVPSPAVAQSVDPAAWAALALLLVLIALELGLLIAHRHTISQWLQGLSRVHRWLRLIGFVGLAILGWHLLYGFPW